MPRSRSRSPRRDRNKDREADRNSEKDRNKDRERRRGRDRKERSRRSRSRSHNRRNRRSSSNHGRRNRRSESADDVVYTGTTHADQMNIDGEDKEIQEDIRQNPMEAEIEGKNEDEIAMMKLMGFGSFNTTKGKAVAGNDVSGANVLQKRKYRQYMNRRGGFNRPLDFVA